jgi:hypothetical protein
MREDMYKVIVERPRRGGFTNGGARQYRNSEERSHKIGMKQGYRDRKWLNENLAPLKRWLAKQVGRPWDNVYSELAAQIDRRNTVQEHIFTHIEQFVERNTFLRDGEVFQCGDWGRSAVRIRGSTVELFVHPVTRILLANRNVRTWQQTRAAARAVEALEQARFVRVLSPTRQLQQLDGYWFAVTLRAIPDAICASDGKSARRVYPKVWDVVEKQWVTRLDGNGWPRAKAVYAFAKRQLSTIELRRHGLTNEPEESRHQLSLRSQNKRRESPAFLFLRHRSPVCVTSTRARRPRPLVLVLAQHRLLSRRSRRSPANLSVGWVPRISRRECIGALRARR